MKVVLIDDEIGAQKTLETIILKRFPNVSIICVCSNIQEAVTCLSLNNPDLIFLDIRLGNENGFDLFNHIDIQARVVFTTAYDQYAIRAIKYKAYDYLLKPVDILELRQVFDKVQLEIEEQKKAEGRSELQVTAKKVGLNLNGHTHLVDFDDIVRCESDGSYTTIYLKDERKAIVLKLIKELEEIFPSESFIRIHQSHLVNVEYIKEYIKGEGGSVKLTNGIELPVSRRKKEDLFRRLILLK